MIVGVFGTQPFSFSNCRQAVVRCHESERWGFHSITLGLYSQRRSQLHRIVGAQRVASDQCARCLGQRNVQFDNLVLRVQIITEQLNRLLHVVRRQIALTLTALVEAKTGLRALWARKTRWRVDLVQSSSKTPPRKLWKVGFEFHYYRYVSGRTLAIYGGAWNRL